MNAKKQHNDAECIHCRARYISSLGHPDIPLCRRCWAPYAEDVVGVLRDLIAVSVDCPAFDGPWEAMAEKYLDADTLPTVQLVRAAICKRAIRVLKEAEGK